VKAADLALPDPVVNAQTHLRTSEVTRSNLIQVMRGAAVFSLADHQTTTQQQVKTKLKEQRDKVNKESLASIKACMPPDLSWVGQQGCDAGDWLSVLPSPMAGTELSADEFCNSLAINYGRNPTGLQPACDGCGAAFSARRAFSCAKGGLVSIHHNKICDELCDMAAKSFTPLAVRNEPKINLCCATKEGTCNP
jgi:hypothetical protein